MLTASGALAGAVTASLSSRPAEWRDYHRRSHTSATDLGHVAAAVRPQMLVLTHQLLWHATERDLIDELTAVYDGPFTYGRDLDVV